MKKLIMAAVAAITVTTFAKPGEKPVTPPVTPPVIEEVKKAVSVDVYDFKLSAKVPYVNGGIRSMSGQTLKGYLYVEFADDDTVVNCYALIKNSKTKYEHRINLELDVFNRIGKANKYTTHSVPVIAVNGYEVPANTTDQGHEFIQTIDLCGSGSLVTLKTEGCTVCGGTEVTYCTKVNKLSGNFTGVMDCLCSDDSDWDHTVLTTRCVATTTRDHYAPFWGTWSAAWNKKLSYEIVNTEE